MYTTNITLGNGAYGYLSLLPLFCEGCVFCGANLASSVMMWFAVSPSVVLLCFAPSEVKLLFAPSEVHNFLPFRRGESQLSIFVVWRPRRYRPNVSMRMFAHLRPKKMGPLDAGVLGHG
jgi:hypothetical protein